MKTVSQYDPHSAAEREMTAHAYVVCLIIAAAAIAALGLARFLPPEDYATVRAPVSTAPPQDSYALIVDALLAPVVGGDAEPLRWGDPLAALHCGPRTSVRVNHERLVTGARVPEGPFELEWQADACHLADAQDARIDGRVKLVVFREDWGMSAIVEPAGLRIASAGLERALVQRGSGWVSRCTGSPASHFELALDDRESLVC